MPIGQTWLPGSKKGTKRMYVASKAQRTVTLTEVRLEPSSCKLMQIVALATIYLTYRSVSMALEDTLRVWAQRPSDSEQARIERTERMVRDAISKSPDERVKSARVFAKGSVKMRTNIRTNSDIDICVQANSVFYAEYPDGMSETDFGNHNIDYTFQEFRKNVELALVNYFGHADVDTSGNKAIRVNKTDSGSRIDADVVPAFEYRHYFEKGDHLPGISLRPKDAPAKKIVNWPHHNYNNSLEKHEETQRRYRKMVRIFKRAREAMEESSTNYVHDAQSFLIESLLWNVPSNFFGSGNYLDDVTNILQHLKQHLGSDGHVKEWGEVNELKYLFGPHQKWTREGALAFVNNTDEFLGSIQ